ncbi:MAG: hypothetical protein RI958_2655 [Actinomycetota bacterium]|jgi:hypothetical protein
MIIHVVTLRLQPGTTPEQIAAISAALDRLPGAISQIRSYRHGADAGAGASGVNSDYGIVATFDDLDGWRAYDQDELHNEIRATLIKPVLADRSSIQFEA